MLATAFALMVLGVLLLSGFTARSASADPVKFTFDQGIINLGTGDDTQGLKLIDPGATPPDPPATLSGEIDGGNAFTAPASGFNFPDKAIVAASQNVDVHITASGAITGNFDPETGVADINIPITVQLSVLGSTCTTSFPLALSTTGTLVEPGGNHDAAPFDPVSGEGSLFANTNVPNSTPSGLVCDTVNGVIGGPGAIWLSGTGGVDQGITSIYAGGENTTFGDSQGSWTNSTASPQLCVPNVSCPTITNSYVGTDGNGGTDDGFIRTATGTTILSLLGTSTGTWESAPFTYDGADGEAAADLTFSLARKATVTNLLELSTVSYSVDLIKESDDSVVSLIPSTPQEASATWVSQSGADLDPSALEMGEQYRIRIVSSIDVPLAAVLPAGSFDYDDVALVASRPAEGPTGPTGPTTPTGPTSPTGPSGPTGSNGPIDGWPPDGNAPSTTPPNASTAIYDGKFLFLRLKCPARFKPRCAGKAVGVTRKSKKRKLARPMTSTKSANQKAGKWKVLKLKVKPKFKKRIDGYAKKPAKKMLVVRQTVKSKKFKNGKRQAVFHKYKVRTATS